MFITVALAVAIGLVLGVLGGGGTMLAVPLLMYGAGLDPKHAIATSLLVVGATSLAALIPHAKRGLVDVRTGLTFGAAGMLGSYVGTRAAAYIPSSALLVGFVSMMLATAVAMLRKPKTQLGLALEQPAQLERVLRTMAYGLGAGALTGLVGAGGGFLIVPALTLLAGLPMNRAVATSLLVITMNAVAGLAGYAGHVAINWHIAASVGVAAMAGSVAGASVAHRVSGARLRRAFGWLIAVTAVVMLAHELPSALRASPWYQQLFVLRWPAWAAGFGIASVVLGLLLVENKQLGVSTGCAELCNVRREPRLRSSWRLLFLGGIVLGGAVASLLAGSRATLAMGGLDALAGGNVFFKLALLFGAGTLIGFGSRTAGGCTSGHSILGTALGSRASWIATALFLASGFVTTQALYWLHGG